MTADREACSGGSNTEERTDCDELSPTLCYRMFDLWCVPDHTSKVLIR